MPTTIEHRDGATEREMPAHQRGLVDTCLEEGQFEPAIRLMEELRSPHYKPPISHIRQLMYISLQPPDPHSNSTETPAIGDPPPSPSKVSLKTRSRIPSRAAIEAAQRLLFSFALTNLPETIASALPSFSHPWNGNVTTDRELMESIIGTEAMCIQRAKSCWHILAEGFTAQARGRGHSGVLAPPARSKQRATHVLEEDDDEKDAVVGEHAWPVLEWLLVLFEQDELACLERGSERFSDILLQQIPSPRDGSGKKWDTEHPLRIVFYCLKQDDPGRQMMGFRLMTMLINLLSAGHLEPTLFISLTFSQIAATELAHLPALLSSLVPSPATHRFKVALCHKFLSDICAPKDRPKPKSQIRAQPRAIRSTRTEGSLESTKPISRASSSRGSLPEYEEIRGLVEMQHSTSASVRVELALRLRLKFELMNSYATLQAQEPSGKKDSGWLAALKAGRVKETLRVGFGTEDGSGESRGYLETLEAISSTWR